MELVLGLAALATAISGATGAGHYGDVPEIKEAEPTTADVAETLHQQEIQEVDHVPESHFADLGGIDRLIDEPFLRLGPSEIENNDDFDFANEIGLYNYDFSTYSGETPDDYSNSVKGSIGQTGDVDYFKFTLYGKASVTITLNDIPNECDYDIKLYEQGNGRFEAAQRRNQIGYSANGSNYGETIEKLLYPNTYYIKVYSWTGYGSPRYTLGLNVSYQRKDVRIADLKADGAKGALWLSDYDPYGIKPSITDAKLPIGSVGDIMDGYHAHAESRLEIDTTHYTFPINEGEYKHAQLFIWDEEYRAQMLEIVGQIYEGVERAIKDEEEFQLRTEKRELENGIVFSLMGFIPKVGTLLSIAQIVGDLINLNSGILLPPENVIVTKTNYLVYLHGLENALTWYSPSTDFSKVLCIPMRYRVISKHENKAYTDGTSGFTQTEYARVWNYYLTYEPTNPRQFFKYEESIIYAQDPENPITGTVFPVADSESIDLAYARQTYNMTCESFGLNTQKTVSLSKGKYKWFEFTAPHDGKYYFKSMGDEETTIDVFNDMVYGKSDYNRVQRFYKNNGINTGINCNITLEEDQTIYLRVSGGNGSYTALSSTTIKIADTRFPMPFANIAAWDLDVPTNLDNPFFFNHIWSSTPYNLYVSSVGAFYNTNRNAIELLCDRDNNKPFAFLIMLFDRPIKQMNFGSCIGNSYSYAHLGLYLQGLNQYGFPVTEDVVDTYCNDTLLSRSVRYDNRDEAIYGVMFRIDPETDTSPYHVGYQEQLLGNFLIEFND